MSQNPDVTNRRFTYYGSADSWAIPATPTDMVSLKGAANKIIRLIAIYFSGISTTPAQTVYLVIKRNVANTGGTFVTDTIVPADSLDPAAQATFGHYTANPTINSTVGSLIAGRLLTSGAAGAGNGLAFFLQDYADGKPPKIGRAHV